MISKCQISISHLHGNLWGTKSLIKILKRIKKLVRSQMIKIKGKNKFGLRSKKVFLLNKIFKINSKVFKSLSIKIKPLISLLKIIRKKKNTSKRKYMNQKMMKIILNISKSKIFSKINNLIQLNLIKKVTSLWSLNFTKDKPEKWKLKSKLGSWNKKKKFSLKNLMLRNQKQLNNQII